MMSVHLAVNIADDSHRVFDEAFFERGMSPEAVLTAGVYLLELFQNAKRIERVDADGNVTEVKTPELRMPGPPHDMDVFNLYLMAAGSTALFSEELLG